MRNHKLNTFVPRNRVWFWMFSVLESQRVLQSQRDPKIGYMQWRRKDTVKISFLSQVLSTQRRKHERKKSLCASEDGRYISIRISRPCERLSASQRTLNAFANHVRRRLNITPTTISIRISHKKNACVYAYAARHTSLQRITVSFMLVARRPKTLYRNHMSRESIQLLNIQEK